MTTDGGEEGNLKAYFEESANRISTEVYLVFNSVYTLEEESKALSIRLLLLQ